MSEKTCTEFRGSHYPKCESTLVDYTGTGDLISCTVPYTIKNNKLYCSGTLSIAPSENLTPDTYLFDIGTYNLTATGFIKNPIGLTNQLHTIEVVNPNQPSSINDYQLNGDVMNVLVVESMFIFGFGILFGSFIAIIRKGSYTR